MDVIKPGEPIAEAPAERLVRWRIIRLPNGDRHFCGMRSDKQQVRVSSRILFYDPESQSGMSISGRIYHLDGPQGNPDDLVYGVAVWALSNRFSPDGIAFL